MVHGEQDDEEISTIKTVLESIKALGKVNVRGKMFEDECQTITLLCECREVTGKFRLKLMYSICFSPKDSSQEQPA